MLFAAVALGLAIGLVVGSVGGGGAILALPVFVYVLGEPVGPAATGSLIVVAVAAAVGAGVRATKSQVCWRMAAGFAPPAAAGALLGTLAGTAVGAALLVLLFVPVMLAAASGTWQRASTSGNADAPCPHPRVVQLVVAGFGVGLMTGFFGVGGGFVIVPVLTLWFGTGFRRAVATSLVIITFTGIVALASHLLAGSEIDAAVTAALAVPTAVGAFAGTQLSDRLPAAPLARGFAILVCAVALFLLVDVLVLGGPPA